jgi:NAD-dependent deacetylase
MTKRKSKLVVLTGAGMSAESGIGTFRGADGLWEGHRVEEVASPEGFEANPGLVLEFYNQRRRQIVAAQPNEGHRALARLEKVFDVHIVTQNVDDLHERAGSQRVLHLHGEIRKAHSTGDPQCVVDVEGTELSLGDVGPDGLQLRPHIVWFGEEVPAFGQAARVMDEADLVLVVGTSLQVYPAAGLVGLAPAGAPIVVVDPHSPLEGGTRVEVLPVGAVEGLGQLEIRWASADPQAPGADV